jgi:Uma2 family endonuclease
MAISMREEIFEEIDVLANNLRALASDLDERTEYEIERGKPMPSMNHSRLQKRLTSALQTFEPPYEIFPELTIELDGEKFTPDISVYTATASDWDNDVIRRTDPPLVTIEIVSPRQRLSDVTDKARFYLAHGVHAVWIVQPEFRIIAVMLPGELPRMCTTGEVRDTSTGVYVTIEEIFR